MKRIASIINPAEFSVSPWMLTAVAATAFALVIISFGLDSVVPGAHDTFHDFRHVIGMACH